MGGKGSGRPPGRQTESETLDQANGEPIEELEDGRPVEPHLVDFRSFFEQKFQDRDFSIKIYALGSRGRSKVFLDEKINIVPAESEIGLTYGSNDPHGFKLYGKADGSSQTWSKVIHLHPIWDRRKQEHDQAERQKRLEAAGAVQGAPAPAGLDVTQQGLETVKAVLEIVKPLLPAPAPAARAGGDFLEAKKFMEGMMEMMFSNMKRVSGAFTQEQLSALKKPALAAGKDDDSMPPIVREILQIAVESGKEFLAQKGWLKQMATGAIKSDPRFQAVAGSAELLGQLYEALTQHPQVGPETADQLFQNLGLAVVQPEEGEADTNVPG